MRIARSPFGGVVRRGRRAAAFRPVLAAALGLAAAATVPTGPARAQGAPQPPPPPLDAYAEAAATTIIAEQSCPGVRLNAGQLTTLRLAARVAPAQESALEEKLRTRSAEIRRQLADEGRDAWCAAALGAFGPGGTVAKGVLARPVP